MQDNTSTAACRAADGPLTSLELADLARFENLIGAGLRTFFDVGHALKVIRDGRLYRASHGTFEAYCRDRWEFNASRARQLIGAADRVQRIKSVTNVTLLPATESQARPLAGVAVEQVGDVWQDVEAKAQERGKRITAGLVQEVVDLWKADTEPYVEAGHDGGADDEPGDAPYYHDAVRGGAHGDYFCNRTWPQVCQLILGREWRELRDIAESLHGQTPPEMASQAYRRHMNCDCQGVALPQQVRRGIVLLLLELLDPLVEQGKVELRGSRGVLGQGEVRFGDRVGGHDEDRGDEQGEGRVDNGAGDHGGGGAEHRGDDGVDDDHDDALDRAARAVGVPKEMVVQARQVREHGTPELIAAVEEGRMDVGTAAKMVEADDPLDDYFVYAADDHLADCAERAADGLRPADDAGQGFDYAGEFRWIYTTVRDRIKHWPEEHKMSLGAVLEQLAYRIGQ